MTDEPRPDSDGRMIRISTVSWFYAADLVDNVGDTQLRFARTRGRLLEDRLTVSAQRGDGARSVARVENAQHLELAPRLRRRNGVEVNLDGSQVTLRRNGRHPRKSRRQIDIRGAGLWWRITGGFRLDEIHDEDGQLIWRRRKGIEELSAGLPLSHLCLFAVLMNGCTPNALRVVSKISI